MRRHLVVTLDVTDHTEQQIVALKAALSAQYDDERIDEYDPDGSYPAAAEVSVGVLNLADTVKMWRCVRCGKWSHAAKKPKSHERSENNPVETDVILREEDWDDVHRGHECGSQCTEGGYLAWIACGPFEAWTAVGP